MIYNADTISPVYKKVSYRQQMKTMQEKVTRKKEKFKGSQIILNCNFTCKTTIAMSSSKFNP